jgi:hypothetical protein
MSPAALKYLDLLRDGAGLAAQVGLAEDVEDDLARGGDVDREWPEGADPAADAQIDWDRPGHQPEVAADGRAGGRAQPDEDP